MTGGIIVCKIADSPNRTSSLYHGLRVSPDATHSRTLTTTSFEEIGAPAAFRSILFPSTGASAPEQFPSAAPGTIRPEASNRQPGKASFRMPIVFGLISYPNVCILGLDVYPRKWRTARTAPRHAGPVDPAYADLWIAARARDRTTPSSRLRKKNCQRNTVRCIPRSSGWRNAAGALPSGEPLQKTETPAFTRWPPAAANN
jgi:hypothetical protein